MHKMAPKCPAPAKALGKERKRHKKVMTLHQKVELLDMLMSGNSFAAVARHYSVNESTVRYIKKKEVEIRKATNMNLGSAKTVSTLRDKNIIRVESALAVWINDCYKKNMSLSHIIIHKKARQLYQQFQRGGDTEGSDVQEPDFVGFDEEEENEEEPEAGSSPHPRGFQASKGWLYRFMKRCQLSNVFLHGEVALPDTEAAVKYPKKTFKIINNIGYCPEQDLAELTKSASEEVDTAGSGDEEEEAGLSLDLLCEIMRMLKEVKEKLLTRDPNIERAMKFNNGLDGLLRPYTNLVSMKKQTQQLPITSYFSVVKDDPPKHLKTPEVQVVDKVPPEEGEEALPEEM
ncbi:tigger transposable element-derived protein 1-like [Macrobrachium rosenbergii]|uniref:tigger transposable element-derived protein 1-like n=1 Tax=Macrobrachium rosenbergii TaxID=79674 RepID=UPI0034D4C3DB